MKAFRKISDILNELSDILDKKPLITKMKY